MAKVLPFPEVGSVHKMTQAEYSPDYPGHSACRKPFDDRHRHQEFALKRMPCVFLAAVLLLPTTVAFGQDYVSFGLGGSPSLNVYDGEGFPRTAKTAVLPFWISSQMSLVSADSVWNPLGLPNLSDFTAESFSTIVQGYIDAGYLLDKTEGGRSDFLICEVSSQVIALPTATRFYFFDYSDISGGFRSVSGRFSLLLKAGLVVFIDPSSYMVRSHVLDAVTLGFSEAVRLGYRIDVGRDFVSPFVEVKGINMLDQNKPMALVSLGLEYEFSSKNDVLSNGSP